MECLTAKKLLYIFNFRIMIRFIVNCFLLLSILLLISSYLLRLKPLKIHDQINDYTAALIDKHQRLSKLPSPKIVFIGGSNLAFGLNSEKVQKDLSIPVVNMGLHARLGLDFILNEVENYASTGDIIIISIEYSYPEGSDDRLISHIHDIFPEAKSYLPLSNFQKINVIIEDVKQHFNQKVKHIQYSIENWNKPLDTLNYFVYNRAGFNDYGDVVRHLQMPLSKNLTDRIDINSIDIQNHIIKMNKFHDKMIKKGVRVYFTYSAFAESEYIKNLREIKNINKLIDDKLDFSQLGTPADFVYPDNYFFDTVYHLHRVGREKRTLKLIEFLKKELSHAN